MALILYSSQNLNSQIIRERLNSKHIQFTEVTDLDEMLKENIEIIPTLQVGPIKMTSMAQMIKVINQVKPKGEKE